MSRDIEAAFHCVRDVHRCLIDGGNLRFPVPLELLIDLVNRNLLASRARAVTVKVECRDWPGVQFRSALLSYRDSAVIVYSRNLNLCWRRLSVSKELAHLLIDTDKEFWLGYTQMLPLLLTNQIIKEAIPPNMSGALTSERLTLLMALELLLPWPIRGELEKLYSEGKTDLDIAHYCKVPEHMIAYAMHPPYAEFSRMIHTGIDKAEGGDWSAGGIVGL